MAAATTPLRRHRHGVHFGVFLGWSVSTAGRHDLTARRRRPLPARAAAAIAVGHVLLLSTACDIASLILPGDHEAIGRTGVIGGHRDPETLIVGRPADALSLDPARATDTESVEVIDQIYDRLLHYSATSRAIEPGLASRWAVSEGGRVWTFALRRGVRFHDGTLLDADAVVFSFERQRNPAHPFYRPDFTYWKNAYGNVQSVEKLDSHTVRITIERVYAPLEANLAMFPAAIVSPAAIKKARSGSPHPVGTGPFSLVSWIPGERMVLQRNEAYWGGAPRIKRLVFTVIPDPRQRLTSLASGSIDIAYSLLPEELQFVRLHPNLILYQAGANNIAYLALNTGRGPFGDQRVRRAANHAINKELLVKLVYQGLAIPAHGPLPPTQWGYQRVENPYAYDIDRARELLAEAVKAGSFVPGRVLSLYAPSTSRPYLTEPERLTRVLQANLAEVGMKTRIVIQDFAAHLKSLRSGAHDLCLHGWVSDNGDPDNYLYTLLDEDSGGAGLRRNFAYYRNAQLHEWLLRARQSADREERIRLYRMAQNLIHDEAPWVPLAHSQVAVAARDDVGGVVLNSASQVSYRHVWRRSR